MARVFSLLLISLFSLQGLHAQDKKKPVTKSVCETPIPSRAAAIGAQAKTGSTASKKLSCCAGIPSRQAATASASKPKK